MHDIAWEGMDLSAFKILVKKKAFAFDDEMVSVSQQYRLPERTMRYTRWRSNPRPLFVHRWSTVVRARPQMRTPAELLMIKKPTHL